MTQNGSFIRSMVSNLPAILTGGSTENLATGQIGIFDGETYKVTVAPVYNKNKSIIIAQGYNSPVLAKMGGMPGSRSEKTDVIKGSLIRNFKAFRGKTGLNDIIAIGYDGVDARKTLTGIIGETKHLYIKLTGEPVNKIASPNGLVRRYSVFTGVDTCCGADCVDCTPADINAMTDSFVNQINNDRGHSGFVRASKKVFCTTAPGAPTPAPAAVNKYQLSITDAGGDNALGRVQAQYPTSNVVRVTRDATQSISVYELIAPAASAPGAFTTSTTTLIPDCPTCPSGYTTTAPVHLFELVVPQGAVIDGTKITGYSSKQLESSTYGRDTYLLSTLVSGPAVTAVIAQAEAIANWEIIYLRDSGTSCALTTPTTTAWTQPGSGFQYSRLYRITLQDDPCGSASPFREAELRAAFTGIGVPTLVVGQPPTGSATCTHAYEMAALSQYVDSTCYADIPIWVAPPSYAGVEWVQQPIVATAGSGCSFGIILEGSFVNRITNECTYGFYAYEQDGVHVQVSNYDPNYNAIPQADPYWWPVTELQSFRVPQNFGGQIRKYEEDSKEFALRAYSQDPAVREAEGYKLFTDPYQYYDQYSLYYSKRIGVGGFSTVYEDRHVVNVYFPTGQGKSFENAMNSYISSIPGLQADITAL